MIVAPESNELFTSVGDLIVETFAANSNDYVDVINQVISLGSFILTI